VVDGNGGLTVSTYHFLDFAKRGILVLDVYCDKKVRLSKAVKTAKGR
jgi:hypothetical protein